MNKWPLKSIPFGAKKRPMKAKETIVAVDTGGTFTDFVYIDNQGRIVSFKVPSTPKSPDAAVMEGLKRVPGERLSVLHGSTVATNAVIERKGGKVLLVTNRGMEDIIEIGRQNRKKLYRLDYKRPDPLVPSSMRLGLNVRVLSDGSIETDIEEAELERLRKKLEETDPDAVAVSFLFSFKNPSHEIVVGKEVERFGIPAFLSHRILPEFREYERTSTTVVNAYVYPKVGSYIKSLSERLKGHSFSIMQSNGGIISSEIILKEPARTILSGPAGGVIGALKLGKMSGLRNLITLDMGGTSTDVSLIQDGKPQMTTEEKVSGMPIRIQMIEIETIGSGGGSIARIDRGGALKVGPESAGADPGPACYGKGNHITITDANMFLGRMVPEFFLGGKMRVYPERITPLMEAMAKDAGLDTYELAEGIITVANSNMERAIRVVTVERGIDPRGFSLFVFGGAGALHGALLARSLDIPKVVIPKDPGVLSAMGILLADVVRDTSKTVMLDLEGLDLSGLEDMFLEMENPLIDEVASHGIERSNITISRSLDMRFKGQSHEVEVPFSHDIKHAFESTYRSRFGHFLEDKRAEIVNLRVRVIGKKGELKLPRLQRGNGLPRKEAVLGEREVIMDGRSHRANLYDRERLLSGDTVDGPSIILEYSSTTLIPEWATAKVDDFGNIIVEVGH